MTAPYGEDLKKTSGLRNSDANKTTINFQVRHDMTIFRLVQFKDEDVFDFRPIREMLGGNLVRVKNQKSDTMGKSSEVTATILVELNNPSNVTLGSKLDGLDAKVLSFHLAPLSSDFTSIGANETDRKPFTDRHAEEVFLLQLLALVSIPEAKRAIADFWQQKKPLPDSQWRPPLLVEVQEDARAAGGAAAPSLSDRVQEFMEANFEKTDWPRVDEVLLKDAFIEFAHLHKMMVDNGIVGIGAAAVIQTLRETGFDVREFNRHVEDEDGSIRKRHVKNAVLVRRLVGDDT
jgi:hypothetical protein